MTKKAKRLYNRGLRLYYAMGQMLHTDLAVRDIAVSCKDIVKQARSKVIDDYGKAEEELKRVDPDAYNVFKAEIGVLNTKSGPNAWSVWTVIDIEKREDDWRDEFRVRKAGMDLSRRAIASGLWDEGLLDCRKSSNPSDWIPREAGMAINSMPPALRAEVLFELMARSAEIHNTPAQSDGFRG